MTVLERVRIARTTVYEYMNPFVITAQVAEGNERLGAFPSPDWLLAALASYAPTGTRYAESTLDYWQQRGLILRQKRRGPFDLTRMAALLITRLAEDTHERNWLPSEIHDGQQFWFCYAQEGVDASPRAVSVPPGEPLHRAALLSTPWLGAWWQGWRIIGDMAFRWHGDIDTEHDLEIWEPEIAEKIIPKDGHPLIEQESVRAALLREGSRMLLETLADQHQQEPSKLLALLEGASPRSPMI